jgi:uncharacterized protein YjbI with pentapeptide repeats
VASKGKAIPSAVIISTALLVFFVATLIIIGVRWPNFLTAVAETTTTTTHYTSSRGEERVREVETVTERQKVTFWQLVGTLVIPLAGGLLIAWGGFKFNQRQREREEVLENMQAQDNAIQAYIDQMSDLLVDRSLRSLPNGSDIHKLAAARTLEVLLGLDGERKRRPLKLVYGLGLIMNRSNPGERNGTLLDLDSLSLDHADLTELSIQGASLRFADLRGANLQGADLSKTDLSYSDLRGANLTNTDLSDANLSGANLLPYDENNPAKLSLHNLKDHGLPSDDYLRNLAKLQGKHRSAELKRFRGLLSRQTRSLRNRLLGRKPVTFTNLTDAKLVGANLAGAILANADLRNADKRGLTEAQVSSAIGNRETKLPKADVLRHPLTFPKTWSDGIEAQIKEFENKRRRKE